MSGEDELEAAAEPLLLGASTAPPTVADTARAFLPLPFIAFGGPQAHVGIMLERFVTRKRWLSERLFTELLAISNALPGPASTQLAFTIALIRAGPVAAVLAFLIWSIPGAIIMGSLGYWLGQAGTQSIPFPILHIENGLSCAAVALVAIAARKLGTAVLTDNPARLIATAAACALILFPADIWLIPVVLALGGAIRFAIDRRPPSTPLPTSKPEDVDHVHVPYSRRTGLLLVGGTIATVAACAWLRTSAAGSPEPVQLFATFVVVGAIVFGGGPVVIPMLYSYMVQAGHMSSAEFLVGLAVINCMPGPNFNFAAFCGALALRAGGPWASAAGALLGWLGIFLPGLTIKAGVLPVWSAHRQMRVVEVLFKGFNAVAVGFLFAAVYILWEKAVVAGTGSFGTSLGAYPPLVAIAAVSFVLVDYLKAPVPGVLALAGAASLLTSWLTGSCC